MLNLERLEARDTPSAVTLADGVLTVALDGNGTRTVSVDSVNGQTRVTLDGAASSHDGVTSLVVNGSKKAANVVQNNTALPFTAFGGNKGDTIFGGTGVNFIDPGKGDDVVYALLGTNSVSVRGDGRDRVFTNAGAAVDAGIKDVVARFFGPGRTPGTPFVGFDPALNDGVLYVTPSDNGSFTRIDPAGKRGVAVTHDLDLGDGVGPVTTVFQNVRTIAYFGGAGPDNYVNTTRTPEAVYGSAGDDRLVSGRGDLSLLKGSGGDDTLIGRARKNDLSGNGGSDLIALTGDGKGDVVRADAFDVLVGLTPATTRITP